MENTLIVPKTSEKKSGGVVDVKFEKTDIFKFFSESQGIIYMVNAVIKPLLKCFGDEEEKGLSIFCKDFASKEELKNELELFFPNSSKTSNKTTIVDHRDSEQ